MSVAGIIFLAKLHAYRAALARGETEQAAVRFAAEAEYAEDKRLEDRLALYPELVEACQRALAALESPKAQKVLTWTLHREALQTLLAQAEAIEKGE